MSRFRKYSTTKCYCICTVCTYRDCCRFFDLGMLRGLGGCFLEARVTNSAGNSGKASAKGCMSPVITVCCRFFRSFISSSTSLAVCSSENNRNKNHVQYSLATNKSYWYKLCTNKKKYFGKSSCNVVTKIKIIVAITWHTGIIFI